MGHPNSQITFGIPRRSGDNRLWTRYPQGDAPNSGSPQGLGATSAASASTGSANAGVWADVVVGMAGMGPALATPGRVVGLDLDHGDYGARADTVNGASVTRFASGAYDGSSFIRVRPPTGATSNPNQTYAGIANGVNLWNDGTTDVAQANAGFCMRWGSRYIDLGAPTKLTGFLGAPSLGGATTANARTAVFDERYGNPIRRILAPTAATVQSWHQPTSGYHPEEGPDTDKLLLGGFASANHGANPPQVAAMEWLYCEQEADYRQDRGNAFGRNRFDVWARDGYLGFIEIPLTHNASWSFANRYIAYFEYLGGLFNLVSTYHDENFVDFSHVVFSTNRARNARMNPPVSFSQT